MALGRLEELPSEQAAQRGCGGPQMRKGMRFDLSGDKKPQEIGCSMNFQRVCSYSVERMPTCSSQGYSESTSFPPSLFSRAEGTLSCQQHLPTMTFQPVTKHLSLRRGTGI